MADQETWQDHASDAEAVASFLETAAKGSSLRLPPPAAAVGDRTLLHAAAVQVARRRLADRHQEKDRILAQEVRALDDLLRAANLLIERLREWYALHAPEATRAIEDAATLARLVSQHGDRDAVTQAADLVQTSVASVGTDLEPADLDAVRSFATALDATHRSWQALEARIQELVQAVAPNLVGIAGPLIGARLIALAGSLHRLAVMPAGTVQTLGAETALFRHRKEGSRPPKHGILFQHAKVHQAPPWQRGAVARAIALHAAIAARADAFTGNDIVDGLRTSLEADLARIARRPRPKATPRGPPRRGRRRPGTDRRQGDRRKRR